MTAAIDPGLLSEVALNQDEYDLIVKLLGREPNHVELGIFGAMWSEHCGYKTSKPLLKNFPTSGPGVLQGPGENAGAVDVGEGWAVVFKIESHNHPSAIEPHAGAATGVGGILRDIFTMGAFPIATLDSLRFGPLDNPRNRHLFGGVVSGIGDYGNCFGVPTVGGEIYFEDCYTENPLVNAMAVGLIRRDRLMLAKAEGPGNLVMLVGADTGRDGIHGATFASVELGADSESRRPAVQVGNPFLEKLLMEACMQLIKEDLVVGMQDLGAAGLTSSAVESASRGGAGIDLDIAEVSRREQGMGAYEVMLSESQERMLIIVEPDRKNDVDRVFRRFDLHADVIGEVTDSGRLVVRDGDRVEADIPLPLLVDEVPLRHPEGAAPPERLRLREQVIDLSDAPGHQDALLRLLASANLGSRAAVFRTYDHQVQNNTVVLPGGDAAVVRIKGTRRGIALSTDGNGRYCYLDPRAGAAIAVAEAARNVVATGARPLAITDCLNFGNPEKPEVFWELRESVEGMAEACRQLGVPVVSGNVSLYNDTSGVSVWPSPVVGMVGLIEDIDRRLEAGFRSAGDVVVLIGESRDELGGSEYAKTCLGVVAGRPPAVDMELERQTNGAILELAADGALASAHDVSDGGLAIALAECCLLSDLGAAIDALPGGGPPEAALLFGESQARYVVSCPADRVDDVLATCRRSDLHATAIGTVGGDRLVIGGTIGVELAALREAWETALG
ncbi:MAG: phosphoribosylformylglycinamidine synthase subunit PurL [Chloroflexota bacterium]|jgi:phosphoribosylformylglycinamidine synthase|nr:phosphoribosylformylglycinamidine synthase subunit PurL [Chloroflexota bacterium]